MKIIALLESWHEASKNLPVVPALSYPDSVMVRSGNPVFLPDFDSAFKAVFFLAVKISRLGKSIAERFASRYYVQAAPAMVVFPSDLVAELGRRGLPWTSAACFDRSVVVGDFQDCSNLALHQELTIKYSDSIHGCAPLPSEQEIAKAIQEVSRNNALKMGDLILVPLRFHPISLHIDSYLTISSGDETLLKTSIK